jgi:hypothetical protein
MLEIAAGVVLGFVALFYWRYALAVAAVLFALLIAVDFLSGTVGHPGPSISDILCLAGIALFAAIVWMMERRKRRADHASSTMLDSRSASQ